MKKLFFILAFAVVAMAASAQGKAMLFTSGYLGDTLTNSETSYAYGPAITASANQTLVLKLKATNLTGTTAATAFIQESLEGTDWVSLTTTNTANMIVTTNDTVTIVNGTVHFWTFPTVPGYKYRIKVIQTGTSTTAYLARYFIKPN